MSLLSFHAPTLTQQARGQLGTSLQQQNVPRLTRTVLITSLSCLCTSMLLGLPARAQLVERSAPTPDRISARTDVNDEVSRNANILQPGDELELTVLGFPDLSGRQAILADGSIQLPLVGSISIAGLTPDQATDKLTASLTPYVRRPQIGLALLDARPPQVAVTGEVRRPGAHLLVPPNNLDPNSGATGEELQTLTYALVSAGGVTPNADLRNIVIRRRLASVDASTAASFEKEEIRVNLWNLIQEGDLSSDVRVYNGDEIIVPTAELASSDREKLLDSTLAPESISVQVAGGVRSPGQLQVAPDADITTAVIAAGGFNEDARKEEIALFRVSPEGRLEQKVYAFGDASETLVDGDVIVVDVKKRRLRRALGFIGSILNPFGDIFD